MVEWKLRLGSIRLIKTITLPRVNTSFSWNIFLFLFIVHIHFRTIIFHSWFFLIFNETSISNFFSILFRWIRTFLHLSKQIAISSAECGYLFILSLFYLHLVGLRPSLLNTIPASCFSSLREPHVDCLYDFLMHSITALLSFCLGKTAIETVKHQPGIGLAETQVSPLVSMCRESNLLHVHLCNRVFFLSSIELFQTTICIWFEINSLFWISNAQ